MRHAVRWAYGLKVSSLTGMLALSCLAQDVHSDYRLSPTVSIHQLAHRVPKRAAKEFATAMKALEKADPLDAVVHLKEAISIDPEFVGAMNNLGATYVDMNMIDLAVDQFEKAIATDPHISWIYGNLAFTYIIKGDYQAGERAARQCLNVDPTSTRGKLVLGIALVMQNRFTAEAERSLRTAEPECREAMYWLGLGYFRKGQMDAARYQVASYLDSGDNNQIMIENAHRLIAALERNARSLQTTSQIRLGMSPLQHPR